MVPLSPVRISDPADERLRDYVGLTDVALRRRLEPAGGLYIAESKKVIRRALAAGHRPRSYLMAERWLVDLADVVAAAEADGIPVYVGAHDVIEDLTGFHLHRGALAAMYRPVLRPVEDVLRNAERAPRRADVADSAQLRRPRRSRIAVFESLVDHTNLGAAFRSAAALGIGAVLVTPRCADPLYRRAIRVSMGAVFQVPWTRIDPWPHGGMQLLKDAGYTVAGMSLGEDSTTLDELAAEDHERLALVFGTEGHGLMTATDRQLDRRVTIPMMNGVDSLNVAASSAVAFYATR
ncbi:RRNA methyltransferase [Nostocoides japonicum T1-X7]|uniref:rRNA methyltransferase n=1 Tax=Nostocoides japonicum T1-X7 TaxID=1194083 RepID=A0A077M0E5_9MICO|nr:RNA methyltransferase [Tetrasphaera japonica]CCH77685.1 RRNA methyltransferase [Tetrasphaera japonica T1-X7]